MTKQEAKDLTLEVWKELALNGELSQKYEISKEVYEKIKGLLFECPLCELFNDKHIYGPMNWHLNCSGCPLKEAGNQCFNGVNFYSDWEATGIYCSDRETAAQGIVDIVENWVITP